MGSSFFFSILDANAAILDRSSPTNVSKGKLGLSGSKPPWNIIDVS